VSGWNGSNRRSRLPKNWPELVANTKRLAGGRCQAELPSGARCPRAGAECDHVEPGDDHSQANLQWLCKRHHQIKTIAEARTGYRKPRPPARKHPDERHPGLRQGTLNQTDS
jgi:5-methylcytosine-specific restriction protein A